MKRTLLLLASIATLLIAGCTGDSKLPDPTGKGTVWAINAIADSPEIGFLIEERTISGIRYKNATAPADYDDFSYNFNFEYINPSDSVITRLITQNLKIEANRDHIFLLSGSLDTPTVTVLNGDIREFAESDTVFEVRFAHASETLGSVDVYFEAPGVAPGTNPPSATLAFGEIVDPADFEEGPYIMTITDAGNPGVVHFSSRETSLLPRFAHVMTIFDGDANDTAPILVNSMTSVGNPLTLTDANYPAQIRLIHAASTLQEVDVYDDDLLTNLVVAGLDFREATPYLDTVDTSRTLYFTPAASTATILFEETLPAPAPGTFADVFLAGDTDAWGGVRRIPSRAPTSTVAKVRMFHAALNNPFIDAYVTDRGVPLTDDTSPAILNALFGFPVPTLRLQERDFDLFVTVRGELTQILGPYQIDAVLGDNFDLVIVDTVDPLTAEIIDITTP